MIDLKGVVYSKEESQIHRMKYSKANCFRRNKIPQSFTILLWLCLFLLPFQSVIAQRDVYVSSRGSESAKGDSPFSPTNLESAVYYSQPGDHLWLRNDGPYQLDKRKIVIEQSGTKTKPIIIEGYDELPGDIRSIPFSGMNDFPNTENSQELSLIKGYSGAQKSIGIEILGDFVHIKNLAFEEFCYNIVIRGNNVKVENCRFYKTPVSCDTYGSFGVLIHEGKHHNEIFNCFALNIEHSGFTIWKNSTYNHIHHNLIISSGQFGNPKNSASVSYKLPGTDYPIAIQDHEKSEYSGTRYNIIEYNFVRWIEPKGRMHPSHGIDNKGGAHNSIRYNVLENCGIEIDFVSSQNNTINGNLLFTSDFNHGRNVSIEFQSGPKQNLVWGNLINGGYTSPALKIIHADDGAADYPKEQGFFAENYVFNNVFINSRRIVDIYNNTSGELNVQDFHVFNNTIIRPAGGLFNVNGNKIKIIFNNNLISHLQGICIDGEMELVGSNNNFYSSPCIPNKLEGSTSIDPQLIPLNRNHFFFGKSSSSAMFDKGTTNIPYLARINALESDSKPDIGSVGFDGAKVHALIQSKYFPFILN